MDQHDPARSVATPKGLARLLVRWLTYNAVGLMGMGVQLVTLVALSELGRLNLLVATALAVETAILHNFVWHERWTWVDRLSRARDGRWRRLARFNLVSGTVSITGNVLFTGLYATSLGLHYVAANVLAIASVSLVNFVANDRLVFQQKERTNMARSTPRTAIRRISSITAGLLLLAATPQGAELQSKTVGAWSRYVQLTEQRIEDELVSDEGFLVQDFDRAASSLRAAVQRGEIPVSQMRTVQRDGTPIKVPGGAIHHWRGAIFIQGVTLNDVLDGVQSPLRQEDLQEDVLESRVIERTADRMKVFLKLKRKKFVTVHYNTEHDMRYARRDSARASSRSVATKIAELADVGSPDEREQPIGNDRGFLWRLNSYWRYEEVDGGVIVECESVTLSRSIPSVVRWMVAPMIRSTARESMARTLTSMHTRLVAGVAQRAAN